MKLFTKIVNGFQLLNVFAKSHIGDITLGSEDASNYLLIKIFIIEETRTIFVL